MGSVLEPDNICSFNDIISLNHKHGDGLPGFIFWGYLKEFLYKTLSANLQNLMKRTTREFHNLSKAMLAKAVFRIKKKFPEAVEENRRSF